MSRVARFSFALGLVLAWTERSAAQAKTGDNAFQWKFGGGVSSTSLSECDQYTIQVIPGTNSTSESVAPYYMIAWAADGIPTTSYIGNDSNNLQWTANQPTGSKVMLTVADSVGNSGGEAPNLFTVIGSNSSCLPKSTGTELRIVANISTSDTLGPCQQLGLRVYGGTGPYNISIAALNSPVVTNFTLGQGDDVATWINRADASSQLMVSVSDSTGIWGNSTGIFTTSSDWGEVKNDCNGLATTSGNSANVDQHPAQPKSGLSSGALAAAIVVPIIAVLLIGAGVFFWWRRRKQGKIDEPALMPDAWTGPANDPYSPNMAYRDAQPFSPYAATSAGESKLARYRDEAGASSNTNSNGNRGSYQYGHSPYSRDGSSYGGEGGPSIGMALLPPPVDGYSRPTSSSGSQSKSIYIPNQHYSGEGDIIIQHRDGGAAIQEIPPPYLDHSNLAGPSGASSSRFIEHTGPSGSTTESADAGPSNQTNSPGLLG